MKSIKNSNLLSLSIFMLLLSSYTTFAQEVKSRDLTMNINVDGLLYHENGTIFASGGWNGAYIYKIKPDGTTSIFANGFTGIVDMVWGTNDTIIGSSYQTGKLLKIAPDGTKHTFVQSSIGVAGLYKDFNGDIICTINPGLAHPSAGRVIKVKPDGTISTFASGGSISKPSGATQDEAGNYYISNLGDGRITKVKPDGTKELFATIPSTGQWKIGYIKYWKEALYTSAISQHKVYKTTLDGEVSLYAGTGSSIDQDGTVPNVSFKNPNGMVVSGDTLFVISAINVTNKLRYIMESPTGTNDLFDDAPKKHQLDSNFPNPFNRSTSINYKIIKPTFVELNIYNALGEHVDTIVNHHHQSGDYVAQWNATDSNGNPMTPGLYIYELSADLISESKKMLLLR